MVRLYPARTSWQNIIMSPFNGDKECIQNNAKHEDEGSELISKIPGIDAGISDKKGKKRRQKRDLPSPFSLFPLNPLSIYHFNIGWE